MAMLTRAQYDEMVAGLSALPAAFERVCKLLLSVNDTETVVRLGAAEQGAFRVLKDALFDTVHDAAALEAGDTSYHSDVIYGALGRYAYDNNTEAMLHLGYHVGKLNELKDAAAVTAEAAAPEPPPARSRSK